jgi:type I restriction enzyme S subunit
MSRYKAYPEYKDSGVEWVGAIPNSWDVSPLFSLASTDVLKNDDGAENNVLSLSYGRIIRRDVEDNHGLLPESFNTYQLVEAGDIILRLTDLQNDKRSLRVGLATEKGIITSAYLKLTAKQKFLDRYLYRLLHSYDTTKVFYGMGGGLRQSMKFEEMRRLQMLCPSLDEQKQIADFLDHETAKIDALIEKQQRLIELLKEKRQAVISHAVTKGLNPNAPLKDSGVEWVDRVPAHWRVSKLGYHASVSNGATPSRENMLFWENGTIGWLNSSKVNDEVIQEADQFITKLALSRTSVKPVNRGDLLMAITGEGQTRGRVAICNIEATINQHLAAISIYDKLIHHEFLYLWLEGNYERIRYESEGAGSTKGAITCSEISAFPVILPPPEEQDLIVGYVAERKRKFDRLIREAISAIELIQERRTALISAAVTGKIDVRDWQAAA